ncbi:hypothetical protein [Granulosicoccus antarcticus]|uniref:Uncharacterized protein n=1 Tax=Granulosicoccus antarcticus IMCC3135 TaxID=1192854 RepID=A0A2Z2NT70_9GAMM|nr:hypothetical protein [Granulosicoccus antarcticus]ASJ73241.1 hypothetical protein IMCC3135_15795 [Granulosicoccus antarcticus IMCC3135]
MKSDIDTRNEKTAGKHCSRTRHDLHTIDIAFSMQHRTGRSDTRYQRIESESNSSGTGPEENPTPVAYSAGPQSIFDFTDADLAETSFSKDTPDGLFYTRSNNTALVSGPVLGTGTMLNSELRRIIPYTLTKHAEDLEMVGIYLLRGNRTSILDSDLAVGIVRNNSASTHCHIRATGISLLNVQGEHLSDYIADSAFVRGASGTSSPWRDIPESSPCLGVGDFGYFRANLDNSAQVIGGIAIEQLDYFDREFVIPTPTMIPLTFEVTENGLQVRVVNQSTVPLEMPGINIVFLDEGGLPLGMDRWNSPWQTTLEAGEERVFDVEAEFRGSTSTIRFVLDLKG